MEVVSLAGHILVHTDVPIVWWSVTSISNGLSGKEHILKGMNCHCFSQRQCRSIDWIQLRCSQIAAVISMALYATQYTNWPIVADCLFHKLISVVIVIVMYEDGVVVHLKKKKELAKDWLMQNISHTQIDGHFLRRYIVIAIKCEFPSKTNCYKPQTSYDWYACHAVTFIWF